jgi:hypothetical protein
MRLRGPQKPQTDVPAPSRPPSRSTKVVGDGIRNVQVGLKLLSATGRVTVHADAAPSSPACLALAACGDTETVQIAPRLGPQPFAYLGAEGSDKIPFRDYLAALGLRSSGDTHGIQTFGALTWTDRGDVSALATAPGQAACHDSQALIRSVVGLSIRHHRLLATYLPQSVAYDALRTQCPGPTLGPGKLLHGSAPLVPAAGRTTILELTGDSSYDDSGYHVHVSGRLRIAFRAMRIKQTLL